MLATNKWFILLIIFLMVTFYWSYVRPIRLTRACMAQASMDARTLLRSKAEVAKGTAQGNEYQKLIEKNLYLRTDYESFLTKCLLHNGLQITRADRTEDVAPAQ